MNNNKVCNEEVSVPCNILMNDRDYLNDLLESEKNISNNYSIALNEMSNKELYKAIFKMFTDTKDDARALYNLMFKKGWYTLEKAESTKISEEYEKTSKDFNELIQK